ncbi:sphingosine 1-phosphate receptor 2-like [Branchiostoma floridae]|uniref:Sphingosine 1-phosphate receptor 2-like n=1 Tax=Branchiostoma floridae TaxID=7739 RepID=A0A9J7HXR8_BRAFL|nr:sphingosine 1-phosphate receptor 2-like [Branchiostoma floridae]
MNGSTMNLTGGNSTVYDTFWPCLRGHLENRVEYDLAVAACSHLPTPFLDENRKVGIASAAVGTIALLLNGAVLSGVLKNRDLSKPVYLFVANLAAADCMAGVFSLFFCASFQLELLRPLTMLGLICAYFLVLVLSAVGVILLSMDRYVAILHPTYYQTRMSGRHVAVTLGIAWPACAVVCLSPVMGWNCIDMDTETCMANMPVVYVILIKSILLMAVVTVVFGNVRIFITLMRRFSRDGPPENPQENVPAARRREQRIAARQYRQLQDSFKMQHICILQVTVVIVAAVFVILWLPICVGTVEQLVCFAREDCEVQARPYWGLPIALCNSVINPIIYALRIEKIRDAVQRRARRLANAVREKLGWTSNQVVNGHQTVGDAAARDGPGPSADNRTGQSAKWAVSRRLGETTRNTQNSNRLNVLFVASPSSVKVGETPSTEYIE